MIDYGKVIYLDMQKTGSTYITRFLDRHLDTGIRQEDMHGSLPRDYDKDAYCFTSLRDPLDQYASLYRYGCDGRGGLYRKLLASGIAEEGLYDGSTAGFEKWLHLLLDPKSAPCLASKYAQLAPTLYGFMTFRYLRLALPNPLELLPQAHSAEDLKELHRAKSVVRAVVFTETLQQDLARLLETDLAPFLKDKAAALADLRKDARVNTSRTRPIETLSLDPGLRSRLVEREWFLYEMFPFTRPDAAEAQKS